MPPPLPIRPLLRQLQGSAIQSKASISSTSKNAAIKDLGGAASKLIDFDDSATTPGPATPGVASADRGAVHLQRAIESRGVYAKLARDRADVVSNIKERELRDSLSRQMTRKWSPGDTYAPVDLSIYEMKKWKEPRKPTKDIIDIVGLNPLDHYKNFAIISDFMTDMGRIKHSKDTGLRAVNQRKMAKAIRRAIGMGIHPSTHKHPELIFGDTRVGPRYQNTRIPEPNKDKVQVK